jgi:hypothetical protein
VQRTASRELAAELARPLFDSWWAVVAGVCLGLAAGLIGFELAPKEYRASVTMAAEPDIASTATLQAAALAPAVVAGLAERSGLAAGSPRVREAATLRLADSISASPTPDPGAHELAVRAGDPQEAARLANTLGEILATSGGPYELARRASPPSRPISPRPLEVYLLGLAVGLIVFVGPPVVRAAVNPVICNKTAIGGLTPLPVLVSIPRVSTPEGREDSRRRLLLNVFLSAVSAFGLVATILATRWV